MTPDISYFATAVTHQRAHACFNTLLYRTILTIGTRLKVYKITSKIDTYIRLKQYIYECYMR